MFRNNKKRIKELENRLEKLDKSIREMCTLLIETEDKQDKIDRIIRYSIPGKITHIHNVDLSSEGIKRRTTIYKDFREYVIKDLPIDDDEKIFTEEDNPNLLFSIDEREKVKYIIDLNKCTFIKLSLEENK